MKKIPVRQISPANQDIHTRARFNIRKVSDIMKEGDLFHGLHRHEYYFILLIEEGRGVHEIDFIPHKVQDHSIFMLRPGQVHQLELKAGAKGYLLECKPEFYHATGKEAVHRVRKAWSKGYCRPSGKRFDRLRGLLGQIYTEYIDKEEGFLDAIKANLDLFFIEFIRQSPDPKGNPQGTNSYSLERLEEFQELLERHIAENKQVSFYTQRMNLSAYQLNEVTRSTLGKTASEMVNEQILLEARRYLLATTNQVKEVADHLGYEDVSYFIRFFRKHTGLTPEAFRTKFSGGV